MNFANTWYVIKQNHHFATISHEAMSLLPEGGFTTLQNFETRHEAQEEHMRLVRLAIHALKQKLGD